MCSIASAVLRCFSRYRLYKIFLSETSTYYITCPTLYKLYHKQDTYLKFEDLDLLELASIREIEKSYGIQNERQYSQE